MNSSVSSPNLLHCQEYMYIEETTNSFFFSEQNILRYYVYGEHPSSPSSRPQPLPASDMWLGWRRDLLLVRNSSVYSGACSLLTTDFGVSHEHAHL